MAPLERIVIASDHGGVALKAELVQHMSKAGYAVEDIGTQSTEPSDYPDYAHQVARGIVGKKWDRGILVCGSGVGMAMAANRHAGVRAVSCTDTFTARFSRMHNGANVLCLGQRVTGPGLAWDIVDLWLKTAFESTEERHVRRVGKIELT